MTMKLNKVHLYIIYHIYLVFNYFDKTANKLKEMNNKTFIKIKKEMKESKM
jgi:hypothetical protein